MAVPGRGNSTFSAVCIWKIVFVKIIDELEEFTSDKEIAHKAFKLDSQMFIFVRINYDWDNMLYIIDNLVSNITS